MTIVIEDASRLKPPFAGVKKEAAINAIELAALKYCSEEQLKRE